MASIEDIEETETSIWIRNQLQRIRDFLQENGGDDEMLDAIDYLEDDNERWIDPKIEKAPRGPGAC
jgi:hypothetical protein